MIISELTITNPEGPSVTLGDVVTNIDSNGNAYGYSLDSVKMDPAPTDIRSTHLPSFDGGVIASGRKDVRAITITGTIVGRTPDEANTLLRQLQQACDSDLIEGLISLTFTPVSTLPEMKLRCLIASVVATYAGGNYLDFTITATSGDAYAQSSAASSVSQSSGSPSAVDVVGDIAVYPTLVITTAGEISTLTVDISGVVYSSTELTGVGLPSGTNTIAIIATPGYENVVINGVTQRGLKSVSTPWPYMGPGSNTVTFSVSGGGSVSGYSITWTEGWKL